MGFVCGYNWSKLKKKKVVLIIFIISFAAALLYTYVQIATKNYERIELKKAAIRFCYNEITKNMVNNPKFVDVGLVQVDTSKCLADSIIPIVVLNIKNALQFKIGTISRVINDINYRLLALNGNKVVMKEVKILNENGSVPDKTPVYINPFTGRAFGFTYVL